MAIPKPPYDPQLMESLVANGALPPDGPQPVPQKATINARREFVSALNTKFDDPDLLHEEITVPGPDGNTIQFTIVKPKSPASGPRNGIYYIHGGGMIVGTRHFLLHENFPWIKELDAILISVEYRLAPEHPHPAPVEDCFAGLKWVSENASKLGINPDKIMIAGHSAGGGLAAGTALMARDRKLSPPLFAQLLIYPMIDDRMTSSSCKQYMNEGPWTGKSNIVAWDWLLPSRDVAGIEYAAPSRATDLSNLPPAYLDVGTADVFRDETVAYASKLWEDGSAAELHVYPGGAYPL
jgi:acetyl esterase/lipase